ncbi:hypothetical protein [Aeoliella mucimassa]|uniref:Uncharacterized protein n=1 Tax=Aeoliella mucimassa TaxID=2527972 RepID=A0A518AIG8_9BACT|nr:hypothetical protein [Aeoliella mucimassa]QDU54522.1 hypothetical protein Pan181_07040 [Aeoliella mucimassa]
MDDPPPPRTYRLQFSVAGLLITTTLVALFCGLLSIGSFELAILEVFVLSLLLMVFGAHRGREHPSWAVGCLVAAVGYAALNFGLLVSTLAIDAFAIFSSGYFLFALVLVPLFFAGTMLLMAIGRRRLHWTSVLGYVLWVVFVAMAHFWLIAGISASV